MLVIGGGRGLFRADVFCFHGGLPWVTTGAGLLALAIAAFNIKDYLAFHQGFSPSRLARGRASIFQQARSILRAGSFAAILATTVVLAIAANSYGLLCIVLKASRRSHGTTVSISDRKKALRVCKKPVSARLSCFIDFIWFVNAMTMALFSQITRSDGKYVELP